MAQNTHIAAGETFDFKVHPSFLRYMPAAVARLGYLERTFSVAVEGEILRVSARTQIDRDAIARTVNHALYREKIRTESVPLRARFLDLISKR